MDSFLNIVSDNIAMSNLQYDIFCVTDMITGLCINSKYEFPVYKFSEDLCKIYKNNEHRGYFNILHYYEKKEAINYFFKYAKKQSIKVKNDYVNEKTNKHIVYIMQEIAKRPGQYICKNNMKNIKAFTDGYFAGEDLNNNLKIGTSLNAFEQEFNKYILKKYLLHEEMEWYKIIERVTDDFDININELVECLRDFFTQ